MHELMLLITSWNAVVTQVVYAFQSVEKKALKERIKESSCMAQ